MRALIHTAGILTCVPLLFAGAALGGEGVQVKITNDGTEDILVTVTDKNTQPERMVLTNARINGFTSIAVNLVGDATGRANVKWTATSADANSPRCGRGDSVSLSNESLLSVHADSSCGSS